MVHKELNEVVNRLYNVYEALSRQVSFVNRLYPKGISLNCEKNDDIQILTQAGILQVNGSVQMHPDFRKLMNYEGVKNHQLREGIMLKLSENIDQRLSNGHNPVKAIDAYVLTKFGYNMN
jgi:hypothetical protein